MGGGLRIHLIGPFEIEGRSPAEVGSRKARTLVKALALARGRPVAVDRLVDVLWREERPARLADDRVLRSRCLAALGRAHHSLGQVDAADDALSEAVQLTSGPDAVIPAVWRGLLLVHTGEPEEALELLRPATGRLVPAAL